MKFKSQKACATLRLAGALTLAETWLLMELISINKEESGYFNWHSLNQRTSLRKGLESIGMDLADTLAGLVKARVIGDDVVTFVSGSKKGPWHKTNEGNMVGHEFELARDWLVLHAQINKTAARAPTAIPRISELLAIACRDHQSQRALA